MFKRDSLLTRLLAVVLTIAVAWAASPIAVFGANLPDAQTQETASDSSDGSTSSDAQQQESVEEAGKSSVSDTSSEESADTTASNSGAADTESTSSAAEASESTTDAAEDSSSDSSSNASKALVARAPAADANGADSTDDASTFTAHWTNKPDSETSYTNKDYKAGDPETYTDISTTPTENSNHSSTLYVKVKLDGSSKTEYAAGDVKIYVPAGFYQGLDDSDPLKVACTDAVSGLERGTAMSQIDMPVLEAPQTGGSTSFNYSTETQTVNGKQVTYCVLTNYKTITGATQLEVNINYRYRPSMLNIVKDGSDTSSYSAEYPVWCNVNNSEVDRKDLGVSVKTKVNSSKLTLTHATEDANKGVYFTWNDAWGTKPADANNYFYVVWYATYQRGGGSTMPYSFKLNVDSNNLDGGKLIGAKKYAGFAAVDQDGFDELNSIYKRMDDTYAGIYGNESLLDKTWIGVSNNPTVDNYFNANMTGKNSMAVDSGFQYQVYALLVRYPLSLIKDAADSGVDVKNDGITPNCQVTVTETWQNGKVVTYSDGPTTKEKVTAVDHGIGSRNLSKNCALNPDDTFHEEKAYQSFLAQGDDVTLDDFMLQSYNYSAPSDSATDSSDATSGFDIKDGSYYLFSGTPYVYAKRDYGTENISANKPQLLTEDEYSLTSFYLSDNEYDGTKIDNVGWVRNTSPSNDYGFYQEVEVWIRKKGESGLSKYGTIKRTSDSGYTFTGVDGTSRTNVNSGNRVDFPEGTVQVEVKQESSKHYASDVQFYYGMTLHPDDAMVSRIKEDIDDTTKRSAVYSAIGGFASGKQTVNSNTVTDSNGVESLGQYWNSVSYELSAIRSSVAFSMKNQKSEATEEKAISERVMPVKVDMYESTNVYSTAQPKYATKEYLRNYIPRSGEYYILLPAGTYADGVKTEVRGGKQITPTVEYTNNWNGSGRTMMKVSVSYSMDDAVYASYWSGIYLYYNLHDTYTNIVDRGSQVNSSVLFVNTTSLTTGEPSVFPGNVNTSIDDWDFYKSIYDNATKNGCGMATTTLKTDFGTVKALESGLTSLVSTQLNQHYQKSGETYLGDTYTDRLQYTAASTTRTSDLVLYDVFSNNQNNAVGTFDSVDISSIDAKPTYDSSVNKTTDDTCKPVVYYATKLGNAAAPSLDDSSWGWSTTKPDDLSAVKAIAIDCRKTDKKNDFVLDQGGTIAAYVTLKASTNAAFEGRKEVNSACVTGSSFNGKTPASDEKGNLSLNTSRDVTLLAPHLAITMTSDPESGTADNPAEIGNEANKKLNFTITVKNNASDKPDVTMVHVTDALPEGFKFDDSASFTVPDGIANFSTGADGRTISYDIAQLSSQGSIAITIPVVRENPVTSDTYYTCTATIYTTGNSKVEYQPITKDVDNKAASTYHKTVLSVSLPFAGGVGFGGLVIAGSALVCVSAAAWIRRRRRA